jgi:hypothetical protein
MDNILLNNHQSECLFQSRECPFTKFSDVKCPWSGILSDIVGHVRSEHGGDISENTSCLEMTLQNFSNTKRYYKAIFSWGKLFYLVWETTQLTFYFSVFQVGPKNEAEDFIYDFKICKLKDNISITGTCHSYLESKHDFFRPGVCVTLHYRTVQMYLSQNAELVCEIEIRKKSSVEVNIWKMANKLRRWRLVATPSENPSLSEDAWHT